MIFSRMKWMGLGVVAATTILAGCVADDGGSRPPARPGASPQMCSMNYAPVCAERGSLRKTFANDCVARADGFRVVQRGQCTSRPNNSSHWWGPGATEPAQPLQNASTKRNTRACTRDYKPVCARRGNLQRTFPNSCEAQNAGFRIWNGGQCR